MAEQFNPKDYETIWAEKWLAAKIHAMGTINTGDEKFYSLYSFPYPSGAGLHVGHVEGMVANDIAARYNRMKGKKTVLPMGWDSFGLPAENYAIKTGIHPRVSTDQAVETFKKQINRLGISVDWDSEVGAHWPSYYKWTQWIFLQLFKAGLAYKKKAPVNWCPKDQTVLANEQVVNGKCERCDTEVVQKDMEQWFFKVTEYAEELHKDLDKVDWPESTKAQQRNWIGRSEGAILKFEILNSDNQKIDTIEVFTTRADTIYSAAFLVLAPEHPFIEKVKALTENIPEIDAYVKQTKLKTELERQTQKDKTGAELKGIKAINPSNNQEIPVYISDFVLAQYGTGAVFGDVHDDRDFEFVKKFNIKATPSIVPEDPELAAKVKNLEICFTDYGILINSDQFTGMRSQEAIPAIIDFLAEKGSATRKINYRLRDWLVSRQRYWGAPIPMIYSERAAVEGYGYMSSKPLNILVIHGFAADSNAHWIPSFKAEAEELGHKVFVPDMPNAHYPKYAEWMTKLENDYAEILSQPENLVIVGHSLGGYSAMKLAEKYKIANMVLVAPPTTLGEEEYAIVKQIYAGKAEEKYIDNLNQFLKDGGDYQVEKIQENLQRLSVFFSNDDTIIDKNMQAKFKSEIPFALYKEFENYGHFSSLGFELSEFMNFITPKNLVEMPGVFPENNLPVDLPDDVDFLPTGESPLVRSQTFHAGVVCPIFGTPARREVDTMDTFVDSSWYFFRHLDAKNDKEFVSPDLANAWLPTDLYMIGAEHIVLHLLYSRFFTKFFNKKGYINFDEPFYKMRHMGTILGPDGRKMSKRWGNVINPDDEIVKYGADAVRMYEMFMGPLDEAKPWNDSAESGVYRFLNKLWNLQDKVTKEVSAEVSKDQKKVVYKLIKKVGDDINTLSFNTSVAKFMETVNFLSTQSQIEQSVWENLLTTLAPFAPFISEELWKRTGDTESIHLQKWPTIDESLLADDILKMAVQVNGKVRDVIEIQTNAEQDIVLAKAMESEAIKKYVTAEPKKVIFVRNKILNIIV